MKAALHQGGANALNFYSTTAGDFLGWAYLPDIITKPGQAFLDGVVIDWESIPGTSSTYAGRYDQGETATHEVGHWLNLEHTFFGACNAKGDFVDDTPAETHADVRLPGGQGHLPGPGPGPDPQLHGLLLRLLLHAVHAGPDPADARRLAAVSRTMSGCPTRPDGGRSGRPQNLKPATYRCPFCDQYLSALSEHLLVKPEATTGAAATRTPLVLAERKAGRLPLRDEIEPPRPGLIARWRARRRGGG